jgi:hypothetical protein
MNGLGALVKALGWILASYVTFGLAFSSGERPSNFGEEPRPQKRTTKERPALAKPEAPEVSATPTTPPPDRLLQALVGDPYGPDCTTIADPYWPFDAKKCTYGVADRLYEVTVATPSPERVASWIVDASAMIPALAALESKDHDAWEKSLAIVARYTMRQSGRAFPLDGVVFEDFEGANEYEFRGGVTYGTMNTKTRSCSDCACRIDSLHRTEWCTYVADGLGPNVKQTYDECLSSFGGEFGWNDAWASQCLRLHALAWENPRSESYRALLHFVEVNQIEPATKGKDVAPSEVVKLVDDAFEYPHRRAR